MSIESHKVRNDLLQSDDEGPHATKKPLQIEGDNFNESEDHHTEKNAQTSAQSEVCVQKSENVDSEDSGPMKWTYVEEVPDIMLCKICCDVFESPQFLTCCGMSICKECIEKHIQRAARLAGKKTPLCPFCMEEFTFHSNIIALEQSIRQLKVQCRYQSAGCCWTGIRQSGKLHLKECGFVPVHCPNKCDCKRFERRQLRSHLQECKLQQVRCSFEAIGCESSALLVRKGAQKHTADNIHAHLLLIAKFNAKILNEYRSLATSACSKTESSKAFEETIYTQNKALISAKLTIKSLKLNIQEAQQKTALIKQELAKEEICLAQLKTKIEQLKAIEDDYKGTNAQIEVLPIPASTAIYCPPIMFTINNFNKRLTLDDMWLSPPFYTHEGGYKLCLSVCTNRESVRELYLVTRYISVNIYLLMGEFDDHLE